MLGTLHFFTVSHFSTFLYLGNQKSRGKKETKNSNLFINDFEDIHTMEKIFNYVRLSTKRSLEGSTWTVRFGML